MSLKLLSVSLLVAMSTPALAQNTPAPGTAPGEPVISPKSGQSQDQLARDRYECYGWAKQQSGFNPAQPAGGRAGAGLYRRGGTACMIGRGYQVSYPAPAGSPPPMAQPMMIRQYWWQEPELVYRP